jgi:hypothetical protein
VLHGFFFLILLSFVKAPPISSLSLSTFPADYMMRFVSEALVEEVLEKFMPGYQEWPK